MNNAVNRALRLGADRGAVQRVGAPTWDETAAHVLQRDGRFVARTRPHALRPELKVFNAIQNRRRTGGGLVQRQGRRYFTLAAARATPSRILVPSVSP